MPIDLDVQFATDIPSVPTRVEFARWANSVPTKKQTTACLRIVDEPEARALNHKFRKINKATNVLSFPAEFPEQVEVSFLGDIVVCASVVQGEAQQQHKEIDDHWAHLLIHGLLHLQGYDHVDDEDAHKMEALEIEILSSIGISNPY